MQIFLQLFYFCKQINMSMSISALILSAPQLHFFCTICPCARYIYVFNFFVPTFDMIEMTA